MTKTEQSLNEVQAAVICYMDHNGVPMTRQRKTLIEILGEFKDGFTMPQLMEKADKHGFCEKTIFNFVNLCRKAKTVNPPPPAYYSFNVVDPEIVTGGTPI